MKKLILLFLLIPSLLYAQVTTLEGCLEGGFFIQDQTGCKERWQEARMSLGIVGGVTPTIGTDYTNCSEIGTAQFYWNGDHASGTTYGCINSTTSLNGTLLGATVVDSDTDPGVSAPGSGNNVLKVAAGSQYLRWPITAGNIFKSDEGRMSFDVYLSGSTGVNAIIDNYVDASNYIRVSVEIDNTITFRHMGQASGVIVYSTDTVPDTTWTNVQVRWSVINNKISVKIGAGVWKDDVDADPITVFTAEPTNHYLAYGVWANTFYIGDFFTYTTSGL